MRTAGAYYLVLALSAFSLRISGPYGVLWMQRGMGLSALFIRQAAYAATQGLLEYPTGALADRLGRCRVYACGYALVGISFAVLAARLNMVTLVASSVLVGAGLALASGALEAWITDRVTSEERGSSVARTRLERTLACGDAVYFGAMTLAGLLGSALNWLLGLRAPVLASAAFGLATAACVLVMLPENYGSLDRPSYAAILSDGLGVVMRSGVLVYAALGTLLFQTGYQMFGMLDAPLLSDRGVPDAFLGMLYAAADGATSLGSLLASRLMVRWRSSAIVLSAGAAWSAGLIVLVASRHSVVAVGLYLTLDCLCGVRSPALKAWRNALIPASVRATALSVLGAVAFLGSTVLLGVAAPLGDRVGVNGTLLLASCLVAASSLVLALAKTRDRGVGRSAAIPGR